MDHKEKMIINVFQDFANEGKLNFKNFRNMAKKILSSLPSEAEIAKGILHKYDHDHKMNRRDYELWDDIMKYLSILEEADE